MFWLADYDYVLVASSEFSRVLGSGRPIAAYLSLRSAGGGHAVGILASSKGATFFDPNFGEYHNQNAFLGLLWVLCSHVPARYGVRYNALMATRLEGTPRDAAFLAQV